VTNQNPFPCPVLKLTQRLKHDSQQAVVIDTSVTHDNAMQCNAMSITEAGRRPLFPAHSKS